MANRYAAVLAVLMSLATLTPAVSLGSGGRSHAGHALVRVKLCQTRRVLTTRVIPANGQLQRVTASVNGHQLQGWGEAPRIAGFGGHGVVVQVTFTKKAGPATVRLASARVGCTRVHVLIVWG